MCLSATVSNAEEFADWITTVRGPTEAVIEERAPGRAPTPLPGRRPELGATPILLPTFVDGRPNPEAARLDCRSSAPGRAGGAGPAPGRLFTPRRVEVVDRLDDDGMLPAIYFIFSRAGCDDAVDACLAPGCA